MTARQALRLMRRLATWRPPEGVDHLFRWLPDCGQVYLTLRRTIDSESRTIELDYSMDCSRLDGVLTRFLMTAAAVAAEPPAPPVTTAVADPGPEELLPPAPWLANALEDLNYTAKHTRLFPGVSHFTEWLLWSIESERVDQPAIAGSPGGGAELRWVRAGRALSIVIPRPWVATITRRAPGHSASTTYRGRDCRPMVLANLEWLYPDLFYAGERL